MVETMGGRYFRWGISSFRWVSDFGGAISCDFAFPSASVHPDMVLWTPDRSRARPMNRVGARIPPGGVAVFLAFVTPKTSNLKKGYLQSPSDFF